MAGVFAFSFSNMDAELYYICDFWKQLQILSEMSKNYKKTETIYPNLYFLFTVFNVTLLFRFFLESLYVSYLSSSLRPLTIVSLFTPPHFGKSALISDLVTGILILLFLISTFKHIEVKYMLREFKTRAVYHCVLMGATLKRGHQFR